MALSFRDVAEILKIIDASDCEELVLELEGTRLVVRRHGAAGPNPASAHAGAATDRTSADPTPEPAAAPARSGPGPRAPGGCAEPAAPGHTQVRAPMVGTFYRCPAPGEPPFVEVGARVKTGDPLCLIEVMKLYTTIEAPADGVVERIGAEDAAIVESDQLLFVIAPA